jgi:hypothetical protein
MIQAAAATRDRGQRNDRLTGAAVEVWSRPKPGLRHGVGNLGRVDSVAPACGRIISACRPGQSWLTSRGAAPLPLAAGQSDTTDPSIRWLIG